jgi:endonuclease/exonuclease/phosphatase family metal-dependent hydrolase
MAKAFSVASWNVKHFKGDGSQPFEKQRVKRVFKYLKDLDPDVLGIYEVEGKEVYSEITKQFPDYTFEITEGKESQEILAGVRKDISCFFTQKTQFRSAVPYMRPGLLATIVKDDVTYSLLFLHLASFPEPRGFGLRDDMLYKAVKFRHVLDPAYGGDHKSNYIFFGDLNTMGMKYPYKKKVDWFYELQKWDDRADTYYGMKRLSKTSPVTWRGKINNKFVESNLDHVYASNNLTFKVFDRNNNQGEVEVRGWVDLIDEEKDDWIKEYSDHSLLHFEVQKTNAD